MKKSPPKKAQPTRAESAHLHELFNESKNDELEKYCRSLLVKYPKDGSIWQTLGTALQRLGRLDDSIEAKIRGVQFSPNDAIALFNLGNSFRDFGRYEEAEQSYKKALKINPKLKRAYYCLGLVLARLQRVNEAETCYQQEIFINPSLPDAHYALGNIQREKGNLSAAELSYKEVIKINPNSADSYNNLGMIYAHSGNSTEAEENFRKALEIHLNRFNYDMKQLNKSGVREQIFSQNLASTYSNLLFAHTHNSDISPELAFKEALNFGEIAGLGIQRHTHSYENRNPQKKLRIGLVSGDFYNHAVAYFIEPLLACFNKNAFEFIAYYNNFTNDFFTQKLKLHFIEWREIKTLMDHEFARQVKDDEIDILIDLTGHTALNRLFAFAYKPAPVQISWLGYLATTGVREIDYYLVDYDWCPRGMLDDFFIEKLVRLPSAGTFSVPNIDVSISLLPALKNGYFTFGSFNRPNKITQGTLDLWCDVLNSIPTSKMIVGNVSDHVLQNRLTNDFIKRGVSSDRLIFYPKKSLENYLELHNEIDLILDTFPYSGGTITNFALWMGVPVLTYAWKSLAGRMSIGMLGRVNLQNDFVAETSEQFVEIAMMWSQKTNELQILRSQLRTRMQHSTKSKPEDVVLGFEKALKMMWERFCDNVPVESFDV
jgi:protein O-GlcNAc transferase